MARLNTNFEKWTTRENLIRIQGWARSGLTMDQIADKIKISKVTLYAWRKKSTELFNALKDGKEVTDYAVMNALLKNALRGDTTAQIFWLKNRMAEQFRDPVQRRLNEAQTEKVKAETAVAKAREKILTGGDGNVESMLNELIEAVRNESND